MKEFKDKIAVITGAASGIGRALAEKCAKKGMKVVLADVEEEALFTVAHEMRNAGTDTIAVVTDVSKIEDVKTLVQKTISTYKKADLLFNNAGVAAGSSIWESTIHDCNWVIGVNLMGVVNCVHEFIPIMIEQNTPCHIVNTSSIAGLSSYHPSALYQLTKHSIVALSEQLHHDLNIKRTHIKVSVLCPGFVDTKIMDAERNRPNEYLNNLSVIKRTPEEDNMDAAFRQMVKTGMSPSNLAEVVFQAIIEEKFYIFSHPELKSQIEARLEDILYERNPTLPPMDGP